MLISAVLTILLTFGGMAWTVNRFGPEEVPGRVIFLTSLFLFLLYLFTLPLFFLKRGRSKEHSKESWRGALRLAFFLSFYLTILALLKIVGLLTPLNGGLFTLSLIFIGLFFRQET